MKTLDKTNPMPIRIENDNRELWLTKEELEYQSTSSYLRPIKKFKMEV